MAKQTDRKLNQLKRDLPEGLIVDAAWLQKRGYSTALRRQYVTAGWLEHPAGRVYGRRCGSLSWQQIVVSLQMMLGHRLVVGGRTALELGGFAHYLAHDAREVHLYGPEPPPNWLDNLKADATFRYHNDRRLFLTPVPRSAFAGLGREPSPEPAPGSTITRHTWGQWNWPLVLSTPERAVLELLDELPGRESFHQADQLFGGLANLSPRRMQQLLADCRSVKVKRLFFYFADRHGHAWLKRLDKDAIELGAGKRMLVKGGKLDATYQITVPEDLDAVL